MDSNTIDLCQLLTTKIRTLFANPLTSESEWELEITIAKLDAVLKGDYMAFYKATERELQQKNETIAKEQSVQTLYILNMQRLRQQNLNNVLRIERLLQQLEHPESGISFKMPYEEVKQYLTYIQYYPDSILDPEFSESMKEYGWRRMLQKYVDTHGALPRACL
jgi:hypothetical protein